MSVAAQRSRGALRQCGVSAVAGEVQWTQKDHCSGSWKRSTDIDILQMLQQEKSQKTCLLKTKRVGEREGEKRRRRWMGTAARREPATRIVRYRVKTGWLDLSGKRRIVLRFDS